jgi:nucleotide-binding universal stress UspA family protein
LGIIIDSFKNILVPVDGSVQSRVSQAIAVFFSKLFASEVTLMHVVSNEQFAFESRTYIPRDDFAPINPATTQVPRTIGLPRPRSNGIPEEVTREVTEGYLESGQTILSESANQFTREGIVIKQKLVEGSDTAQSIIIEAELGNYDLVILGNSGGEEGEIDMHLGSVAKKVAVSVKAPVLVVRQKREIKKILVPVDGSAKEEKALKKASAIAKAAGSKIILLHAVEPSMIRLRPEINEIGLHILEQASKNFKGLESEQKLLLGDPAKTIIQTSKQSDVDLIAMSSGGLNMLRVFFIGSVSDHVLHHATVPVLLVK